MAAVANYCQYKKTNFKLGIVILLVAAVWFAYDGFYSDTFKAKHTNDGKADSTLQFHRKAPPFMFAAAVVLAVMYFKKKDKKIVADDSELVLACGGKIAYSDIEAVDKTKYQGKGYFILQCKNTGGEEKNIKISNRDYDNLDEVLNAIVNKITQ